MDLELLSVLAEKRGLAYPAEDLERLRTMPQTGWSGLHPDK